MEKFQRSTMGTRQSVLPFSLGTTAPYETAKSVRKKTADEIIISITEKRTEKNGPKREVEPL